MARHRSSDFDLDGLARELARPDGPERLSPESRQNLFAAVTRDAEPGPLASLFLPIRRMALAATLPALVLGVLLVGVASRAPLPTHGPTAVPTTLSAEKIGDEVVFRIDNGGTPHQIVISSLPQGSATGSTTVSVSGEFRDRLAGETQIVFYRID